MPFHPFEDKIINPSEIMELSTPVRQSTASDEPDLPPSKMELEEENEMEFDFFSRVPKDKGNVIYYVYIVYGFSCLILFNSVLSTLQFFIDAMPDYNPSFVVSFGFNLFVLLMLVVVMFKGRNISFRVKNNLMSFISVPLAIALPLLAELIKEQSTRYVLFLVLLMLIGIFNSF